MTGEEDLTMNVFGLFGVTSSLSRSISIYIKQW